MENGRVGDRREWYGAMNIGEKEGLNSKRKIKKGEENLGERGEARMGGGSKNSGVMVEPVTVNHENVSAGKTVEVSYLLIINYGSDMEREIKARRTNEDRLES